jgi:hypothetical protein
MRDRLLRIRDPFRRTPDPVLRTKSRNASDHFICCPCRPGNSLDETRAGGLHMNAIHNIERNCALVKVRKKFNDNRNGLINNRQRSSQERGQNCSKQPSIQGYPRNNQAISEFSLFPCALISTFVSWSENSVWKRFLHRSLPHARWHLWALHLASKSGQNLH